MFRNVYATYINVYYRALYMPYVVTYCAKRQDCADVCVGNRYYYSTRTTVTSVSCSFAPFARRVQYIRTGTSTLDPGWAGCCQQALRTFLFFMSTLLSLSLVVLFLYVVRYLLLLVIFKPEPPTCYVILLT